MRQGHPPAREVRPLPGRSWAFRRSQPPDRSFILTGAVLRYPKEVKQKDELAYASRHLTAIEINGTYYSTFKPDSWRKWRDDTPDGFVFAVKASRFCTNRKILAESGG